MLRIGKMYKFESAHYLPNHQGKCKNLHGHQWRVEVVLEGYVEKDPDSPEYGMLIDFKRMDDHIGPIIEQYDHRVLNDLIPNPTAENLCVLIAKEINELLYGKLWLGRVRVWESDNSWAEWKR